MTPQSLRVGVLLASVLAPACDAVLDVRVFPAEVSDAGSPDANQLDSSRGDSAPEAETDTSSESDVFDATMISNESGDAQQGDLSAPSSDDGESAQDAYDEPYCGNGRLDPGEQCDLGAQNMANAYGKGACTTDCKNAPYCGDGAINGPEICDSGGSTSTAVGACNPECTGFYGKRAILPTMNDYSTDLGGAAGADVICQTEYGSGWKALIVGGGRTATTTPWLGDDPQDWVIEKYMYYYNGDNQLIWQTGGVPLLGVVGGQRVNTYAPAFPTTGSYPWSGWADDWTTIPDGECEGWTLGNYTGPDGGFESGYFAFADLRQAATEPCGSTSFLLCVEQ